MAGSAPATRGFCPGARTDAPLGRRLHEGQAVLVQVRREAQGGKGPRLTADVGLVGPCLVYRPRRPGTGLSERRAARTAGAAELRAEAERLRRLWQALESKAAAAQPPAVLHGPSDPVAWLLAEQLGADPERILVADRATLVRARGYLETWRPALLERLEHLPDAFAASGAAEQLAAALEPVVPLARRRHADHPADRGADRDRRRRRRPAPARGRSGGGGRDRPAAAAAAARRHDRGRFRRSRRPRASAQRLVQALRNALADDPTPAEVFPMSPLGLVEISRRRSGPALAERLGRSCPICAGSGLLPSLRRACEGLMRELASRPTARLTARVAPDLHAYLTGAAAGAWQAFGERLGRAPVLQSDALLAPGGYRIEEAR